MKNVIFPTSPKTLSATWPNFKNPIKLFETDLSSLFMIGNQIQSVITGIDGLVDVSVERRFNI